MLSKALSAGAISQRSSFPEPLEEPIFDQTVTLDDLNKLVKGIILAPDGRRTFVRAVKHTVESVFAYEKKTFAGKICGSTLDEDLVRQFPLWWR